MKRLMAQHGGTRIEPDYRMDRPQSVALMFKILLGSYSKLYAILAEAFCIFFITLGRVDPQQRLYTIKRSQLKHLELFIFS